MGFDFWHLSRPVREPFGWEGAKIAVAAGGCTRLHFCLCWTSVLVNISRAVRPAVRSSTEPRGFSMQSVAQYDNEGTRGKPDVYLVGIVHSSVSRCKTDMVGWRTHPVANLWHQPEWKQLLALDGVAFLSTDYGDGGGTPYRKRTRFLGNLVCCGESLHCACNKPHIKLVGYSRQHGCSWTLVAQPYPASLCKFLALAVAENT